ncbi:MFS general substrate transporter [Ganoderma sinense ZZ0214-1]|uniref:MFS general substrate transporter n=1 Tax=Ganoderma sinense ZZ0214-1 TaxID=1077348 RepID=A0A2G8RZN3_9APHY|nr:MFS general substrate transporter [Ganoderma sinense ZZ0214-1]
MGLFVSALVSHAGFCAYAYSSLEQLFDHKGGTVNPEDHLVPAMFECWWIPVCLFGFSWKSMGSIHWIEPIIFSSFSVGTLLLFQAIL